jgi:hypothetical protein
MPSLLPLVRARSDASAMNCEIKASLFERRTGTLEAVTKEEAVVVAALAEEAIGRADEDKEPSASTSIEKRLVSNVYRTMSCIFDFAAERVQHVNEPVAEAINASAHANSSFLRRTACSRSSLTRIFTTN